MPRITDRPPTYERVVVYLMPSDAARLRHRAREAHRKVSAEARRLIVGGMAPQFDSYAHRWQDGDREVF